MTRGWTLLLILLGLTILAGCAVANAIELWLPPGHRWYPILLTKVVQIGLRATGYTAEDFDWPRRQGFRVVQAEECWHRSLTPLMAEICSSIGSMTSRSTVSGEAPG